MEMPHLFVRMYLEEKHNTDLNFLSLIANLRHTRKQKNEKCDITVFILRFLNWYYSHLYRIDFTLRELFPNLKGEVANIPLKIPDSILNGDNPLKNWLVISDKQFDLKVHLNVGVYIEMSNGILSNSWIVLEHAESVGVVILVMLSQYHLTFATFEDYKKKIYILLGV